MSYPLSLLFMRVVSTGAVKDVRRT